MRVHAGFSGLSGGFVGVDIFFVISGYLIARIILTEMREQRFSHARFYERRIRRILRLLGGVVFASLVAALLFALPERVSTTAHSSIFALLGVSNIFFWTQSG